LISPSESRENYDWRYELIYSMHSCWSHETHGRI
jgi:hypothetical protein